MSPRDTLHRLLDEVPEQNLPAAERLLSALREPLDPVRWSLDHAPLDEEAHSEDELRAVAEARAEADRGELIPHDEVKRRWGLR